MKKYSSILFTVFLLLLAIIIIRPFDNISAITFNYVIGNNILNGFDFGAKLTKINLTLFVICPLIIIASRYIYKKFLIFKDEKLENIFSIMSLFGIISSFMSMINYYSGTAGFLNISTCLIVEILIIIKAFDYFNINDYKLLITSSILGFCSTLESLFLVNLVLKSSYKINSIAFLIIFPIFIFIFYKIILKLKNKNLLLLSASMIVFFPIFYSLFVELINILMSRNIFISGNIYIVIYILLSFVLIPIIYKVYQAKKVTFNIEKFYYIMIIMGLVMLSIQPSSNIIKNTDFFESSNSGTAIFEFIKYGKIPLLETFDAHMLYNQISGYLYYFLSGDLIGAIFNPYAFLWNILLIYLLYKLFSFFFSKFSSLILVLFFPLLADLATCYYYLGIIAIIALIDFIKTDKIKNLLLYLISLIIVTLLKLDLGMMFCLSTFITLLFYLIISKKYKLLKKVIIVTISFVLGCIVVAFAISLLKNINLYDRIIEFINLAMSNDNWAYSSIGNLFEWKTLITYILIPLFVIYSLIILIIKNKDKFIEKDYRYFILLILGLAYIFNFSRGIVRHSIFEGMYLCSLSTSILYFVLYFVTIKKDSIIKFILIYISILIVLNMAVTTNQKFENTIIDSSLRTYLTFNNVYSYTEKKDRVQISKKMQDVYIPLKNLFDQVMNEDDTYIDFTNQTLLYTLTNREKPVYVNQSPGLLSNYKTQIDFIEQIENNNVKFALTPAKNNPLILNDELDSVLNNYRYYIITEYISNNYKPIISYNNFILWVRNSSVDEVKSKLDNLQSNITDDIEKYNYSLGYIPYIWGQNIKEKVSKTIIGENVIGDIDKMINITKSKYGNYLVFNIESSNINLISFDLLDNSNRKISSYEFITKAGTNNYVVRVSADLNWNLYDCNKIKIHSDESIKINKIENWMIEVD